MSIPQLRAVTYLCPSVPVELFQSVLEILEDHTGHQTTLQYEWRSDGPSDDKPDPFRSNLVDLAFLPSSGYIALESKKNEFAELLPVTPIFKHPKHDDSRIGTFVDVIVHADKLKHNVEEISDLRGCRWACPQGNCLAHNVTLSILEEMGENVSFFGMNLRTVSHLEAVNLVLNKKVEAAAIDANALTCNKNLLHNGAKDVVTLTSYGPFSPYAIVINTRIDSRLKNQIVEAFEKMSGTDPKFAKFGLIKFVPNRPEFYMADKQLASNVRTKLGSVPYY